MTKSENKIQLVRISGNEDNYTIQFRQYDEENVYYRWHMLLESFKYSLQAIYDMYHPYYEETYLTNGRLYERKYYAE